MNDNGKKCGSDARLSSTRTNQLARRRRRMPLAGSGLWLRLLLRLEGVGVDGSRGHIYGPVIFVDVV